MSKTVLILILIFSTIMVQAQDKLYITVNGVTKIATLESNSSVELFKKLLPLTIRMSDYGGWEKVGDLPQSITRNDRQMTAIPGDIMLYQGRSIVIFYGNNSWSYTPLGKLDNVTASEIKNFLNGSSVDVTLSEATSGIEEVTTDGNGVKEIYDLSGRKINLNGRIISDLPKGFYIINGKKTFIK